MKKITIILSFLVFFALIGSGLFFRYLKKLDQFSLLQVKVTIPEGYTVKDIAEKFNRFNNFDKENFLKIAKEGYLFPDTYFLTGKETEENIIKKMEENFKIKAGEARPEIIIMASLLEREARTIEDRKIISGILWKRLEAGMPLQVDAIFSYIIDKTSAELTLDDLKIDSLYNTYLYKGLPLAPICNPGLDAIDAAENPIDSLYWYYLSDKNSIIHYAKTFEEHKQNKFRYLR